MNFVRFNRTSDINNQLYLRGGSKNKQKLWLKSQLRRQNHHGLYVPHRAGGSLEINEMQSSDSKSEEQAEYIKKCVI